MAGKVVPPFRFKSALRSLVSFSLLLLPFALYSFSQKEGKKTTNSPELLMWTLLPAAAGLQLKTAPSRLDKTAALAVSSCSNAEPLCVCVDSADY